MEARMAPPPEPETRTRVARLVLARVVSGRARAAEMRFTRAFTIGSASDADLQILEPGVAPRHAEVIADGILWWVRDLSGGPGTFVNGARAQMVALREAADVELGPGGPRLRLEVLKEDRSIAPAATPPPAAPPPTAPEAYGGFTSETQILRRFLRKQGAGQAVGRETLMFRRAFERVQRRSSRPYQVLAAVVVAALFVAGGIIVLQQRKLQALRATAERLFYATRAVDVEIAQLEDVVLAHADRKVLGDLLARKEKLSHMEAEYDTFVKELGVYAKAPEDEQVILRVARAFGECEVNVPQDFVGEVRRYVQRWKTTDRLGTALRRSAEGGYGAAIQRVFAEAGLPPQYVYLPLQESGYDVRAVGPATRYGNAKGMWQFISPTASRYGLRIGPLYDQAVFDARDERFEWQKATTAAVRYIKELSTTDGQGSALVVMACYNWGESNVRDAIERLPATPQDRNFWRLLRDRRVPKETYDYVLSIFSAAVICENPRLFGFDLTCPAMQAAPPDPGAPPAGG
jgi:hypothetical protein